MVLWEDLILNVQASATSWGQALIKEWQSLISGKVTQLSRQNDLHHHLSCCLGKEWVMRNHRRTKFKCGQGCRHTTVFKTSSRFVQNIKKWLISRCCSNICSNFRSFVSEIFFQTGRVKGSKTKSFVSLFLGFESERTCTESPGLVATTLID